MNISSPTTTENTAKIDTAQSDTTTKKTEKSKSAEDKKETVDKKDDAAAKEQDFKKVLEAEKAEKAERGEKESLEQQNLKALQAQQNQANATNVNQNMNIYSFDVGSLHQGKFDLTMNYDTASISKDDAKFFIDMVDNKQFAVQGEPPRTSMVQFANEIGPTYKSQPTSNVLQNLIEKAYTENKPVRIDFDNNVSVIMKIDKSGKLTAEFIPGDKAVEEYLRNNIRSLKNRFDEQDLPYNDLFYRQSRNPNKENQKNNKGE